MTVWPKLFVAIDTPNIAAARILCHAVKDAGAGIKLGLEFFVRHGPQGVADVLPPGAALFLDLKLHDIPNTVAGAVDSACAALSPLCLTLHTLGGETMMQAAVQAARGRTRLLGVTVLTSLDGGDLAATGQGDDAAAQVLRLAQLARVAGLDGCVASPHEAAMLRTAVGPDFLLVTPGVRPVGAALGDQKRVMTPAQAIAQGASALVIGRPITEAADPAATVREILRSLSS